MYYSKCISCGRKPEIPTWKVCQQCENLKPHPLGHKCFMCGKPLTKHKRKYCSTKCNTKAYEMADQVKRKNLTER